MDYNSKTLSNTTKQKLKLNKDKNKRKRSRRRKKEREREERGEGIGEKGVERENKFLSHALTQEISGFMTSWFRSLLL